MYFCGGQDVFIIVAGSSSEYARQQITDCKVLPQVSRDPLEIRMRNLLGDLYEASAMSRPMRKDFLHALRL